MKWFKKQITSEEEQERLEKFRDERQEQLKLWAEEEKKLFNEWNMLNKMVEITKAGKIPSVLSVEMALANTAMYLLKPIYRTSGKSTKLISSIYPDLELKIWNKPGWELK